MGELEQNLEQLVDRVTRSGVLGRSPVYAKLLGYLAAASNDGVVCSEMSVAIDVLNKDEDFDVTSDSTVRVYVYKLRQKLEAYYNGPGSQDEIRLSIPKGMYRLVTKKADFAGKIKKHPQSYSNRGMLLSAMLGVVCLVLLAVIIFSDVQFREEPFSDQQSLFWGGVISDEKPVMIVVGDYYIFGESSESGDIRLVREFDINSAFDLRQALASSKVGGGEAPLDNRFDVGLTYLPRGSAYAISQVQEVLHKTGKEPRIAVMSEFSAEDLRSNHIIYIGYISGLDVLENYTFSATRFDVGYSYDELIDTVTGDRYVSDFIEAQEDRSFVDYGLISSFSVAENSQIVVLAGTRDAGLMEMSELAVAPDVLGRMELEAVEKRALISVFEVYGFNLTNISGHLIGSEYLDQSRISGG